MDTTTMNFAYVTAPAPCYFDANNTFGGYLSILYYFIFFFSVSGNVLVLMIIYRFERLTTVTNILLLNLVLSSLIFMTSLPFWAVYQQVEEWIFGEVMCKFVSSIYYLGFYSSVLFLTLLTFDRHLAVVYSLGAPRVRNQRYAVISCAVVWLVSILVCIKDILLHSTNVNPINNKIFCNNEGNNLEDVTVQRLNETGFYIQLILFLIFPLVVIIYCYVRIAITVISSKIVTKFKTVRLIFFIVLLFFVCWTPYNITLLLEEKSQLTWTCEGAKKMIYVNHVTRNLTYLYFCISPIFYTFVGKKFQNYFRVMLVRRFPRLKKHISVSHQSGTNMSTKSTGNGL
ncbi:C-C chemokine receptor type 1-like [Labrus mixtus]|uniref:C-C chemokine receptor type 1-like n=1 Tax=Labrus mixtus TaxID=508554 RepID=UPI0029C0F3F9|nr:C-C chemokine receptor type 1-like [Labrus mixtus]